MTDEEKTRLAKMEEKLSIVDKRVERIEDKLDGFLEAQEQKHYELMNHFSAEASKVGVEFGQKLRDIAEDNEKKIKELDSRKADKWTELPWRLLGSAIGLGIIGMISYAIYHSYTNIK